MPDYVEDPWAEAMAETAPLNGGDYEEAPVFTDGTYEDAPWALKDEPPQVPVVEFDQQPVEDERRDVVALIADDSGRAVALFRDPDEVQRMTRSLSGALVEQVRQVWTEARTPRVAKTAGKAPNEVEVAEELRVLADARDTLTAVAKALTTGADEARAIAGEVLAEVAPDERKAKTVRLADGHGWDLKVSRTQPTEVSVNLDEVQDVLASWLLGQFAKASPGMDPAHLHYAKGVRAGMAGLLGVLTKPSVRTTALDALVRTMEGAGEEPLALRLRHAYGRKSKGEPRIEVKREPPKDAGATDA